MFDPSKQSYAAELFSDYRRENVELLTKFRNIAGYLKKLGELGNIERKEVVSDFLMFNSSLGDVFDAVNVNLDRLVEVTNNLIECLKKEKKDLDNYMSKLKKATTESEVELERLLINYNNEQYDYMQELNSLVPNLIELADRAIGMEDETIESTAGGLAGAYKTLESSLKADNISTDSLFEVIEGVIKGFEGKRKHLGDIVKHLKGDKNENVRQFIGNFKSNKAIMKGLKGAMAKCGRDKDKDKAYSDAKEGDVGKIAKFMQKAMLDLFDGIKLVDEDNDEFEESKKLIKKKIKAPTNSKDLSDRLEKVLKKLSDGIIDAGKKYETDKVLNDITVRLKINKWDGDTKDKVTIGDVESALGKDKELDNIKYIIETLEKITKKNEYHKKDPFKQFLNQQEGVFEDSEDDNGGGDDGDKWYNGDSINALGGKEELKRLVEEVIADLKALLGHDGKLTGGSSLNRNELIGQIKCMAKTLKSDKVILVSENSFVGRLKVQFDQLKNTDIEDENIINGLIEVLEDLQRKLS